MRRAPLAGNPKKLANEFAPTGSEPQLPYAAMRAHSSAHAVQARAQAWQ